MSITYNQNNRQLISGSLNGNIRIINFTADYKPNNLIQFKGHNGIIRSIKFLEDNLFATGGEDNKVKLWNLNGQLQVEFEHQNFVQSILSLENESILSASYDGTIKLWKINELQKFNPNS